MALCGPWLEEAFPSTRRSFRWRCRGLNTGLHSGAMTLSHPQFQLVSTCHLPLSMEIAPPLSGRHTKLWNQNQGQLPIVRVNTTLCILSNHNRAVKKIGTQRRLLQRAYLGRERLPAVPLAATTQWSSSPFSLTRRKTGGGCPSPSAQCPLPGSECASLGFSSQLSSLSGL